MEASAVWNTVSALREQGPLIQCITNFVSMDLMANVLLACGASPAMASNIDEVEEFIGIASALLINMGTADATWLAAMKLCAKRCVEIGKHWVLDPVAAGATTFRSRSVKELVECKPSVVRGNAGEVMAVAGVSGKTRGVDSVASVEEAHALAKELAQNLNCVIAVSGEADYVTDGTREAHVRNGTAMLTKITAAGCSVTAMIAAACAVLPNDPFLATVHALSIFGLAGELAEAHVERKGPGSVRTALLDFLHLMTEDDVLRGVKIASA